jgi:hypothetical protein
MIEDHVLESSVSGFPCIGLVNGRRSFPFLKRPMNPLAFSKQAKKQPTIPCGDPKTFRNVAVTVHGQDFPGKYTRGAFRATMAKEVEGGPDEAIGERKTLIMVTVDCLHVESPQVVFESSSLVLTFGDEIKVDNIT